MKYEHNLKTVMSLIGHLRPVYIQGCRIIWEADLCTQVIKAQILCVWQAHKPASTIHSRCRKPIGSQMSFTPGISICSGSRVWKPISEKPLKSAMAWLQIHHGKGQKKLSFFVYWAKHQKCNESKETYLDSVFGNLLTLHRAVSVWLLCDHPPSMDERYSLLVFLPSLVNRFSLSNILGSV